MYYFRLFVFILNILFEPYNVTPYKWFYFRFSFSTLQYYTLQGMHFRSYFYSWPYNITHCFEIFFGSYFSHYKITHYFTLSVFLLNILFEPYNVTPYKLFYFRFFSNLTILHITLQYFWREKILNITKLHITLDCMFLFWIFCWNLTMLHLTNYVISDFSFSTLQC